MGEALRKKIVQYAKDNLGKQVIAEGGFPSGFPKKGKGECWDLAYMALKESGAKTPYDYGRNNYRWSKDKETKNTINVTTQVLTDF